MAIIIKPIVTEKMTAMADKLNRYGFRVCPDANKLQIKKAVEELFKVKVQDVNVMNCRGKDRRQGYTHGKTSKFRKAIVTLTEDSKTIEFFDSLM